MNTTKINQNNNKNRLSFAEAAGLALLEAGVAPGALLAPMDVQPDGELAHLQFCTDWMAYTVYVDRTNGEIVGFLAEPMEETYGKNEVIPLLRGSIRQAS